MSMLRDDRAGAPVRRRWHETPVLRRLLGMRTLRVTVTAGLIAYALAQLDPAQIATVRDKGGIALLLALAAALAALVALNAVRWLLIARALDLRMSARRALLWTFVGHFFNQFLPTSIGGDVVRGMVAARALGDLPRVITSIALERMIGFAALLALIAIGQPILITRLSGAAPSRLVVPGLLVGFGALLVPLISDRLFGRLLGGRVRRALTRLSDDARRLRRSPLASMLALLISLIIQCANLLLAAFAARRLGTDVSLINVLLVLPTIMLVASLPVAIGGWGLREAGFVVGFSALGLPAALAVTTSIMIGFANAVSALPGALAWLSLTPSERSTEGAAREPT